MKGLLRNTLFRYLHLSVYKKLTDTTIKCTLNVTGGKLSFSVLAGTFNVYSILSKIYHPFRRITGR